MKQEILLTAKHLTHHSVIYLKGPLGGIKPIKCLSSLLYFFSSFTLPLVKMQNTERHSLEVCLVWATAAAQHGGSVKKMFPPLV